MEIRNATPQDIPVLRELEQNVIEAERPFNDAIKPEDAVYYDLEHLIASPDSQLLVIENEGQIVATGYIQIRSSKPSLSHAQHGYLGFMYVTPQMRGRGLNKQVMDALVGWGQSKHVRDFYLDVYAGNSAAIKAYEKAGFASSLIEMKLSP